MKITAEEIYRELYPSAFDNVIPQPIPTYAFREIGIRPIYSQIAPREVDLSTQIGPVKLKTAVFSAAMDTVTTSKMAQVMSEIGGCGIIVNDPEFQLQWVVEALRHKSCLIENPKTLNPNQKVKDAREILKKFGYSTIPIIDRGQVLKGIVFTKGLDLDKHQNDSVRKWMKPLNEIFTRHIRTPFHEIKRHLTDESYSVIPVIDVKKRLKGLYFLTDVKAAEPSRYKRRPLIGMAIGIRKEEITRVEDALKLGIGMVAIDSSHGNCEKVINQSKRLVKLVGDKAATIVGNVADIDGYLRLAEIGVHAVKVIIGGGSICTTSIVTGAAVGSFTLLRELHYTRKKLLEAGKHAPQIIADGGISNSGNIVVALAAGADAIMAGKIFAGTAESASYIKHGKTKIENSFYLPYRGMASEGAIEDRSSVHRYGDTKTAPEGIEGYVPFEGPMKRWIHKNLIELVKGGFAHAGAKNIQEIHEFGDLPWAFTLFTSAGQSQLHTSVIEK